MHMPVVSHTNPAPPSDNAWMPDRLWPRRWQLAPVAQYASLLILLLLSFFLVILMIDLSLRPSVLIYVDFWGLPWPPTFDNYRTALLDLIPPMWRTLWVSATAILGVVFVSSLAAYAFARMRFP